MPPRKSSPRTAGSFAPAWLPVWLAISGLICCWDAGYVLMRPRSMEGGDLNFLWKPYNLYGQIDRLYGSMGWDSGEGFNMGQSMMNLVEITLHWLSLSLMHTRGSVHTGDLLAFASQLMTFWKTVLYTLNDLCRTETYTVPTPVARFVFLYVLPNGCWLLFPALAVWTLGGRLARALDGKHA